MNRPHTDDQGLMWRGRILHLVHAATTGVHAHHALKICVPIDGELVVGRVSGRVLTRGRGALVVPPHEAHWAGCTGRALTLFLEPEHDVARGLRAEAPGPPHALRWLPGREVDALARWLRHELCALDGAEPPDAIVDEVLARLRLTATEAPPLDRRVTHAQRLLDEAPRHLVPLDALAASVALSPSRLAHLFRAQVGLPVRRYGLWQRLIGGLGALGARSSTLADAAATAGFADQAHFTRTCQRMLGHPPSMVPSRLRVL